MVKRKNREEIRYHLTGPNATIRTPFLRDGTIDYNGLRNLIDFVIAVGSRSVILAIGDSLFSLLTDQEVADLTKATVKHTAGRAMVVAVKDDFVGEFGRRLCLLVHDRWATYSGGLKQNHLNVVPYGCDGYLSTFLTFQPKVTHAYWKAIETNNLKIVRQIMQDIELPFWDFLHSLPGMGVGKDGAIHAVYELYGITERWRRNPYYNLNDEEMEKLADFLVSKSLL